MSPTSLSAKKKTTGPVPLYTLEIRLTDGPMEDAFLEANPEIVRTIQIRGNQTLLDLHRLIFNAFDREEEHWFEFQIGGDDFNDPAARRFGIPGDCEGDEEDGRLEDAEATRLAALGLAVGQTFDYWFDYGDDWMHAITVTAVAPKAPKGNFPSVVGRVGASPPQYPEWEEEETDAEIVPLFSEPFAKAGKPPKAVLEFLADRRAMESHAMALQEICNSIECGSFEEAQRAINDKLDKGGQPVWEPRTPVERAQARMFDAFAAKGKKRIKLAREALAISPDCADAYVLLAEEEADTLEEALALYEQGVEAGKRALPPEYFQEHVGMFWGLVETRPFMRALAGAADCLAESDRRAEAVAHWREMLHLNPDDNQGMRVPLLIALLEAGDDAGARRLIKQYEKDYSAAWMWSRLLLTFRTQGPGKKTDAAFLDAMACNPHVPRYMMGISRIPDKLPDLYLPGGEEEAMIYVTESAGVWLENRPALHWLVDRGGQLLEENLPTEPSNRPRRR
jgi:tetratricopeptide (TPR) repeat protein